MERLSIGAARARTGSVIREKSMIEVWVVLNESEDVMNDSIRYTKVYE